jgi:glycosyltransferase involved in cell wall biosynthesis
MQKCDVLVVNNFWGPIIPALFFFWKYKKLVYNAQRIPKKFFKFYGLLDGICCPSLAVTELAKDMLPRRVANKAITIPNPIDVRNFNTEVSPRRSAKDGLVIGYHGRVHPEKGLHILAEAVKRLTADFLGLRLLIIGTYDIAKGGGGDEYKAELERLAGNLIDWHPPVSDRAELASILAGCDLYCYPSVAERGETFGVSPLEAMGVGVPVVVSALSCFKDFVEDGKTGVVFNHRVEDPSSELVSKLKGLLSSKEIRENIAESGAKCAAQFSNERIAQQYLEWFDKLITG